VVAVADSLSARRLLVGRIASLREDEGMGFYFTTVTQTGLGAHTDHVAQFTIKNEVMLCTLNGRVMTIFPGAIHLLDPQAGRRLMSVELSVGMDVALLAASGRKAISPAHFGHPDVRYQPMGELLT